MLEAGIWLVPLAAFLAAYAIGSLTSAVVVARLLGLPDPRHAGSGNPGATNILRLGGKGAAGLTLAGDVLKGTVPVAVAMAAGLDGWSLAAMAPAPFLGHVFPLYSGGRDGGKGVATGLGVYLALAPLIAGGLVLTWVVVAAVTRYSSLAALAAAASLPLWTLGLRPEPGLLVVGVLMALLLVWRHEGNIRRLARGEEGQIGRKSGSA